MTETVEISNTKLWKDIRAVLKTHEIMDGSGHLFLKPQFRLTQEIVESVRADVFAEMEKQGIPRERLERLSNRIGELLWGVGKRQPPKPPKPKQPKQDRPKPKKPKQQWPQPQQPVPTLSVAKSNARQEVRTIQVVVRKARSFHYPRDLPGGDL